MVETITTTLQDELEAQHFDAPIRERLSACLPMLDEAIADWRANHSFSTPGLMIAAATGARISCCDPELAVRALQKYFGFGAQVAHYWADALNAAQNFITQTISTIQSRRAG